MNYHAVGNRCAVDLDSLKLPISHGEILTVLQKYGIEEIKIDIISLARECIGTSTYRRGALPSQAPCIMDCSSFMKWLYGQRGVWLPRRSIQQRQYGKVVQLQEITAGDIVFVKGFYDWYHDDPNDSVGHLGIATGTGTIIHAANKKSGIIETPLDKFINNSNFRGVCRYIPKDKNILTLQIPPEVFVESSDDLRWLVLQTLPW